MRLERTPDKREVGSSTLPRPTTRTAVRGSEVGGQELEDELSDFVSAGSRQPLGGVAQLGERLPCTQEVIGSNPFTSTRVQWVWLVLRVWRCVGRVKSTEPLS
jgi:hypothetical protein